MASAALVCAALAFSPTRPVVSRRELISRFSAAATIATLPAAAHAVSARTGQASPFTGEYDDPKHPGCLRSVKVVGAKVGADGRRERRPTAYVKGVDGNPGCSTYPPALADVWSLEGKVSEDGRSVTIDFSPKTNGRVGVLVGEYDDLGGVPGIAFPDGNKWVKVAGGTPTRRPPNLTINSEG